MRIITIDIAGYACVSERDETSILEFFIEHLALEIKKNIFLSTYRMFVEENVMQSTSFFKFKHCCNVFNFLSSEQI